MDGNVDIIENDIGFEEPTITDAPEKLPSGEESRAEASNSYQHDLKNEATIEVSSDLNCNVSEKQQKTNSDEPIKDKLEMAVKQSEITFLDGDGAPANAELQYKSAVEVYEKTGGEESLLSESVILNATDDGTIVIVTNAEQHSANNIIVYETNAGYVETQLENPVVVNETHQEVEASQPEGIAEEKTADNVSEGVAEFGAKEKVEEQQVEGGAAQETAEINSIQTADDGVEQVDSTNNKVGDDATPNTTANEVVAEAQIIAEDNQQTEAGGELDTSSSEVDVPGKVTENDETNSNDLVEEANLQLEEAVTTKPAQEESVVQSEENHNTNQYETVEEQICAIVKQDDAESTATPEKSISIVEAITRDFDETDSEDADSAGLAKSEDEANLKPDQRIYIVQSREEILLLEQEPVDQPDTVEVAVSENQNVVTQKHPNKPGKESKSSPHPPQQIPSHVLGRNITNPADDPFRNGKVPPKPRLGVKIPYRNLTSQIVSKDEIAQEILERQRNKYGDFSQPQGDVLFAKKLTQRLARKIAPPAPVQPQAAQSVVVETVTAEKINNSDLIAILEGDGDDTENKKLEVGTSNLDPQISKILERQIALKQLNELPRGRGRLRRINLEQVAAVNKLKAQVTEKVSHQVPKQSANDEEEEVGKMKNLKTEIAGEAAVLNASIKKEIQTEQVKSDADNKPVKNVVEAAPKPPPPPQKQQPPEENVNLRKSSKSAVDATAKSAEIKKPSGLSDTKNDKSRKPEAKPKEPATKSSEKSNPEVSVSSKPKDAVKDFLPVERKFSSTAPIKTYTRKRKSSDEIQPVVIIPEKRAVVLQKELTPSYVTKSSRVIKRKVIWDPDEPSTARSVSLRSPKPAESPAKIESAKPVSPSKIERKHKKSPVKSPDKSKKRLSEVDRLLMDEGAVNMLYAFKNTDDAAVKKKKATVISLDRAQRELLNKTNEIKRDLTSGSDKVSPKSLRKKDGGPIQHLLLPQRKSAPPALITRKKSKDSSQSSVTSRPGSPGGLIYHPHHAEASRIIRRHSSSSYSSMEGEDEDSEQVESNAGEPEKVGKRKGGTTAASEVGKVKKAKHTDKDNEPLSVVAEKIKAGQDVTKKPGEAKVEDVYAKYKTFSVKRMDHLVQIILLPSVNDQVYLTPEILQDLTSILKELQQDKECHVILISSSAASFCQGINYKTLVCDKEQTRKLIAKKLAACISTFLKTLSTFTKIIIAGVHGDAVGLGVTMLPLFDMVIASDTATFSIPNARLGCAVEGGSLLSLPHLMHNVLVSELLYASRKLIAAEALRLGMVTRVLWPDKFQKELMSIVKTISNYSVQFMRTTKRQLRHHMVENVDSTLAQEVDTLIQHWTSAECQKNFGVYG